MSEAYIRNFGYTMDGGIKITVSDPSLKDGEFVVVTLYAEDILKWAKENG